MEQDRHNDAKNRNHCGDGINCLLGAKSQGSNGCFCDCNTCLGIDEDDFIDDDTPRHKPKTGKQLKRFSARTAR